MNTTDIERNAAVLMNAVSKYRHSCPSCYEDGCDEMWDEMQDFKAPEGFTTLGAGGSRVAFGKDGFVFKLEYQPLMGLKINWGKYRGQLRAYANEKEFANYIKFADDKGIPEGWKFPATDLIFVNDHPVIVMEQINREDVDYETSPGHKAFIEATQLGDIWCENVLVENGICWVVDFAQ